jgi:hypothetical protein
MRICRFNSGRVGIVEGSSTVDITDRLALNPKWPLPPGEWVVSQLTRLSGSDLLSGRPSVALSNMNAIASMEGDIPAAISLYETQRKPIVQKLLDAASRSADWYEHLEQNMALPPWEFAHEYISRSGRVDRDRLASSCSAFVRQHLNWRYGARETSREPRAS